MIIDAAGNVSGNAHISDIPIVLLTFVAKVELVQHRQPVSAPNDVIFDILLAEDNLVNQKLAVKIPEEYRHSVEIAENGSLAVDDAYKARVLQTTPFDITLMDASMPFREVWKQRS
ncbi:hypothetical protein M378DRAFT_9651 [Amanita muscaria Koide BX008]|uniref:Response regulatory domain-containing protein n=1 Tax=Amanita muscaria (strain Koide BX008) TaxID=946122 RepID=A0A0C2WYN7_AMAMK|nr:hypothetical protein M378DRAFT_9651 [Amanita muscaria Koide BX008]